ncbi:low temperature requirement protein A [Streptococcus suis]|uniref:low temperature requirement protein A n=1 Tax=Streptococcus suis TaxID=1307 RepID=UPI0037D9DFA7
MNFPHIVERCQLITIITFGEMVIAILKNYPIQTHLLTGVSSSWQWRSPLCFTFRKPISISITIKRQM